MCFVSTPLGTVGSSAICHYGFFLGISTFYLQSLSPSLNLSLTNFVVHQYNYRTRSLKKGTEKGLGDGAYEY